MKFSEIELFDALSAALASDYNNRIVYALKNHQIGSYTGDGNMPQLIRCLLKSWEKYENK